MKVLCLYHDVDRDKTQKKKMILPMEILKILFIWAFYENVQELMHKK